MHHVHAPLSSRRSLLTRAGVLFLLVVLLATAATTAARPQTAATADGAADWLAVDAGFSTGVAGGFYTAAAALGGERDVRQADGYTRFEWDGVDGDWTRLDANGLGGVDLTALGRRTFLVVSVDSAESTPARLTLYRDAGNASAVRFTLTPGTQRIPLTALRPAVGSGATPDNVGAIVLEIDGAATVNQLAVGSDLVITRSRMVVNDRYGNGVADAGDVVRHTLVVRNGGSAESAPFTLATPQGPVAVAALAPGAAHTVTYDVTAGGVTTVDVVIQDGDIPAGATAAVDSLNTPFTNDNGQVGFVGALTDSDRFIWFDTAPSFYASSVTSPTLTGGESTMGISDAGGFIYSPSIDGSDGVWSHNGKLAVEDEAAPGFPGGTVTTFHSRPTMNAAGQASWVSGFNESGGTSTEGRMQYSSSDATPGNIVVVLRSDDIVDGLAIQRPSGVAFDYDWSDDGAHYIQKLLLETGSTSNDDSVYVDGAIVARELDPTGDGDNWDNFDNMSINIAGNYLVSGDTDGGTTTDEFIAYNGVIVLREGDTIDGVLLASSASVNAAAINDLGQAAHIWNTADGEYLFFACDSADLPGTSLRVLGTGDSVDVDNNGVADATVTDFNASTVVGPGLDLAENGRIYVEVDLDYGAGELEAVIGIDAPACGGGDVVYVSLDADGSVGGVDYAAGDILKHDGTTWSLVFDASAAGLGSVNIDAFLFYQGDQIVMSFAEPTSVPGIGPLIDDSDLVLYNPGTGTFLWAFDGSDVGLDTDDEDVDAIAVINGALAVSTSGPFAVPGVSGQDEDVLRLENGVFGPATSGTWSLYFDGSDVGLGGDDNRDLWGIWYDGVGGDLYATTAGSFTLAGMPITGLDIARCDLTATGSTTGCAAAGSGTFWKGADYGLTGGSVDGIALELAGAPAAPALPGLDALLR